MIILAEEEGFEPHIVRPSIRGFAFPTREASTWSFAVFAPFSMTYMAVSVFLADLMSLHPNNALSTFDRVGVFTALM